MYMYAKRLSYTMSDLATLREQVRGYLTAKSALSLVLSVDAHISVPAQPASNQRKTPAKLAPLGFFLLTNIIVNSTQNNLGQSGRCRQGISYGKGSIGGI